MTTPLGIEDDDYVRVPGGLPHIPTFASMSSIDEAICDATASKQPNLLVDLTNCTKIDHNVLLYLFALYAGRADLGQNTKITLPGSRSAQDFMRSWLFPEQFEKLAERPFLSLLHGDSAERWPSIAREESEYSSYVPLPYDYDSDDDGIESVGAVSGKTLVASTSYFAITAVDLLKGEKVAASIIKNQWLSDAVLGLLEGWLGQYADSIGSSVMYEAVLNAASHPNAVHSFTTGQLRPSRSPKTAGKLQLSIWDDGHPFAETLSKAHDEFGTVMAADVEEDKIFEVLRRREGVSEKFVLEGAAGVTPSHLDHLMVAAFIKGITSHPVENINGVPRKTERGKGLYLLRKVVIDDFNGKIHYATRETRMTMVRGRTKDSYHVAIRRDTCLPSLAGNLLSLEMPLR